MPDGYEAAIRLASGRVIGLRGPGSFELTGVAVLDGDRFENVAMAAADDMV